MISIREYIGVRQVNMENDPMFSGWIHISDLLDMESGDARHIKRCSLCGQYNRRYALVSDQCPHYWDRDSQEELYTVAECMEWKRSDFGYARLRSMVQVYGITSLIFIDTSDDDEWVVRNGHHRIAAYEELGLSWIPYTDTWGYSGGPEVAHGKDAEQRAKRFR